MKTLHSLTIATLAVLALMAASCSTTRRIPDDEILYTGVKMVEIAPADSSKINPAIASQIKKAVAFPPNNYLKIINWRYPFPLGLWVYNNWPNPKADCATGCTKNLWRNLCSYRTFGPKCART